MTRGGNGKSEMKEIEARELFEQSGAILSGHFRLSSGRHSDTYLQSALVLQHPERASALGRALAGFFLDSGVTVVVGPALGGIVISGAVAGHLAGTRSIFAERENGVFKLRRGFTLCPGERVLVVEDVITTGGSTREVVSLVTSSGASLAGVGVLADRSLVSPGFGVPLHSLFRLPLRSWTPEECPLCREGVNIDSPGSRLAGSS